jgi:pyrroline-5-carboxylate reductase
MQMHSVMQATQPLTLGFIGAGMMASALITGITKAGQAPPSQITASDTYQVYNTTLLLAVRNVIEPLQCSVYTAVCMLKYSMHVLLHQFFAA